MKIIRLVRSESPEKKWDVYLEKDGKEHKVSFGARGYQDFTEHHDEARKQLYLARHKAREDWQDPLTPGFWSRWLLWNKRSVRASLADLKARFDLTS